MVYDTLARQSRMDNDMALEIACMAYMYVATFVLNPNYWLGTCFFLQGQSCDVEISTSGNASTAVILDGTTQTATWIQSLHVNSPIFLLVCALIHYCIALMEDIDAAFTYSMLNRGSPSIPTVHSRPNADQPPQLARDIVIIDYPSCLFKRSGYSGASRPYWGLVCSVLLYWHTSWLYMLL